MVELASLCIQVDSAETLACDGHVFAVALGRKRVTIGDCLPLRVELGGQLLGDVPT